MFRQSLPLVDPGHVEFGFPRTICACSICARSCYFIPGYLILADLETIRFRLAPDQNLFDWSRQHLLASPGAKVLRGNRIFRIPTLVPARREDGACRFLTADNRCGIHAFAPFGCAFFDAHQSMSESDRRSKSGLQAVLESWQRGDLYAQVWTMLAEAGLMAPPPEVCRTQMRQADDPSSNPKGAP